MVAFAPPKEYSGGNGDRPKMADFINALIALEVTGKKEEAEVLDEKGQASTREADVVHLTAVDGRFAGERYENFWVFQKGLQAAIDGYEPGTIVLGRIAKPKNAYLLTEPTAADTKLATKLLA